MFDLTKENWDEYRGNNYKKIPPPDVIAGGGIRFKAHIGKPLSQRLWEDLIHRLRISGLCVYHHNDMQWTVGWPPGHCCIYLDEYEKVDDIYYSPCHHPEN